MVSGMNWCPPADIHSVRLMLLLIKLGVKNNRKVAANTGDTFMDLKTNKLYTWSGNQLLEIATADGTPPQQLATPIIKL